VISDVSISIVESILHRRMFDYGHFNDLDIGGGKGLKKLTKILKCIHFNFLQKYKLKQFKYIVLSSINTS
jgi:hypothetical protein